MNIEPLESRIAPAAFVNFNTATYTDVDGDKVTVTFSKPVLTGANFASVLVTSARGLGEQLEQIDLAFAVLPEGTSITVTAVPQDLTPGNADKTKSGDGFANVGYIRANLFHLGSVNVRGDLGEIDAGDGTGTALKSLKVQSLHAFGLSTGAFSFSSDFAGKLGTLTVAADIVGAYVRIGSGADLGSATIGGSILGGTADSAGAIYAEGNLGPVVVKGDVVGAGGFGTGSYSGSIGAGANVGNVTILGSLLGGIQNDSGKIYSGYLGAGDMGAIKIGHDLRGGRYTDNSNANNTGVIESQGEIASVTIGGSVLANLGGERSGRIESGGEVGFIKIGGDLAATHLGGSGAVIFIAGPLGSIFIGGSVLGGRGDSSGFITAGDIKSVVIRGDVAGGRGVDSGKLTLGGVGSLTIGGALVGGDDPNLSDATTEAVRSGRIFADAITSLKIGLGIRGGNATDSGSVSLQDADGVSSFTLGGGLLGGEGERSGRLATNGKFATGTVAGDVRGTSEYGLHVGEITAAKGIGSLTIGGSLVGGDASSFSGIIQTDGTLGKLVIGGDLRGGTNFRGTIPTTVTDTGTVQAERIGSITIGGSIIAGISVGDPAPFRSGSIHAVQDIGSITVKGSIIGNAAVPVFITASGSPTPTATVDLAIKSLTVGGSALFTNIAAGYDRTLMIANGDAQIGTIKVGGDWAAGWVIASIDPIDGFIGNGDDLPADPTYPGPIAKIASIIIGGQVRGQAGTNNTFGFGAEEIGAMKVGGVAVPLAKGRTNDIFPNLARVLGSSRANTAPDGFAVHVFEV